MPAALAFEANTYFLYNVKNSKGDGKMAALIFLFRLALKLIFAPVILILALFVWFFTWLVCVSGAVLGIVSGVLFLLALAILLLSASVEGFIIYLVLAFLASPFGLPAAALWLLSRVQEIRYFIQERIYG